MSPHFKIILDECTRDGSLKALGASNAINIPLDTLGAAIEMSDDDFRVSSSDIFIIYPRHEFEVDINFRRTLMAWQNSQRRQSWLFTVNLEALLDDHSVEQIS